MIETKEGGFRTRTDICLRCPRGCEIHTVLGDNDEVMSQSGNKCKLGIEYVTQEINDPRRVLPTSVRVTGGTMPLVSAWTPHPMPKALLLELAADTRRMTVPAPVHVGDILIDDWRGMGVQLVASREVPKR